MEISEYQNATFDTAIYQKQINEYFSQLSLDDARRLVYVNYVAEGLAGEAGEVASLVKKVMRDSKGKIDSFEFGDKMIKELGDCMWYISQMCNELGFSLHDVMEANIDKLQSRKERGTLQGSGDDR